MEMFSLNNQIEKVLRDENTSFLNPIDTRYVINTLKKMNCSYKVFYLFDESEKLVVYNNNLDITLFEIKCNSTLTHREILGSLFSHNISEEVFGDIIIDNDHYYIVVLDKIKNYLISNYNKVGNKKIELIECDLEIVSNFTHKFKEINIQTSSLRIDAVISKLIPTSRTISNEIISDQKVIVNYNLLKNKNYILKENDIFSIRGVGKFKFIKIVSMTKSGKYQIMINKYI